MYVCVCVCPCHFQNQEQLKDHDSDCLCSDSDLTLSFGDPAPAANGTSSTTVVDSGRSAKGNRTGSTSEEALEPEPDSRAQELLSRGTRLVFPIEDHIWVALPPALSLWPEPSLQGHVFLRPSERTVWRWERGTEGDQCSELSLSPGQRLKEYGQSCAVHLGNNFLFPLKSINGKFFSCGILGAMSSWNI